MRIKIAVKNIDHEIIDKITINNENKTLIK